MIGQIICPILLLVVSPVLLAAWARSAAHAVPLPVPYAPSAGATAAAAGCLLALAGITALGRRRGPWPANPCAPPRFATGGIYSWLAHPIHIGFVLAAAGVSIASESASGLWLVTPVVVLACAALVYGYELPDLRRRLGPELPKPAVRLAADEPTPPSTPERFSVFLLVFIPWVVIYQAIRLLGIPPDAVAAHFDFEARLPVIEWTEIFYASVYPAAFLAPILARTRRDLREFSLRALVCMAVAFPLFLAAPLVAPPRPFTPSSVLGELLRWERTIDTPACAFPSFHVIWAWLTAEAIAGRTGGRWAWRLWALSVAASSITTGMHAIADVAAGFATVAIAVWRNRLWSRARRGAERIANSWRERRFGPVRVINHGVYAALAAFLGVALTSSLSGPSYGRAILLASFCGLAGAALWPQWAERTPRPLRPFSYFGAAGGVALSSPVCPWLGLSPWMMLGAIAVVAPWIMAIGRLRCLALGCCHGSLAPAQVGIRYTHSRSLAGRLPDLFGAPLHPTPVYSMIWCLFTGLMMARLWSLRASLPLLAGLYLILTGLGRFVEEAYRGELRTPVWAGLRLNQWLAAASAFSGVVLTTLRGPAAPGAFEPAWQMLPAATLFAALCGLALGVDFPESSRRLARLA